MIDSCGPRQTPAIRARTRMHKRNKTKQNEEDCTGFMICGCCPRQTPAIIRAWTRIHKGAIESKRDGNSCQIYAAAAGGGGLVGRWTELDATTKDEEIANRGREGQEEDQNILRVPAVVWALGSGPLGDPRALSRSRVSPLAAQANWTARRHGAALTAARRPNGSAADAPRSRSSSPSEFSDGHDEGERERSVVRTTAASSLYMDGTHLQRGWNG